MAPVWLYSSMPRIRSVASLYWAGMSTEAPKPESIPTPAPTDGKPQQAAPKVPEIGGPKGPEPTRYGDWERNGRCTDF